MACIPGAGTSLWVLDMELPYEQRTWWINEKKTYKSDDVYDKITFLEELKNIKNKEWKFQHYNNFNNYSNNFNLKFLINHYDLSHSLNIPTFVKSRNLISFKKSIILPLEDLYIPSFYDYILTFDIPFNKKLNN